MFTPAETTACRRLVQMALEEDLGRSGDLTCQALIPEDLLGQADLVARKPGVLAGMPAVGLVLESVDARLQLETFKEDGMILEPGVRIARVSGPMRGLLVAERTALNFLQRLSGVATQTRRFVEAVAGLPGKILDTRKTTPGWRLLEKYSVRQGGGTNHRRGLYDGILIKDNHLAALGGGADAITRALAAAREQYEQVFPVEIEVDSLEQFEWAVREKPDVILLDNMNLEQLREAVRRRKELAPDLLLEASGGISLETVRGIAETGVDRISVGALTHSAVALDIALDYAAATPDKGIIHSSE